MSGSILASDRLRVTEIMRQIDALRTEHANLLRGLRGTCPHERILEIDQPREAGVGGDNASRRKRFCLDCSEYEDAAVEAIGMPKATLIFHVLTAKPTANFDESQLQQFMTRLHREGRFNEFEDLIPTT